MIKYALRCDQAHGFEGWFSDSADYDDQYSILDSGVSVRWGGADGEEEVTIDVNGNAIVNSAGTFFGQGLRRATGRDAFEIALPRELPGLGWSHTVNANAQWGAAAGTLKLGRVTATSLPRGSVGGWLVTFPFVYEPLGWNPRVLDSGYKYQEDVLDETGAPTGEKEWFNFADGEGRTFSEPSLLDGSGGKLDPGQNPVYSDPIKLYEARDFSVLNLPSPFERV